MLLCASSHLSPFSGGNDIKDSASSRSTGSSESGSTFSAAMHSSPDFTVLKEISRGTMSTVYFCEGDVALKCMGEAASMDSSNSSELTRIYQNDLTVLQTLPEHPYIVRLYDTTKVATV